MDIRSLLHILDGNEYESPWDLESEIIEVVKQMKNPSTPLAIATSTQSLHGHKSVHNESPSPLSSSTHPVTSPKPYPTHSPKSPPVTGLKVDYDTRNSVSHKVRQPTVQRQASSKSTAASSSAASAARLPNHISTGVKSVLVEGEWRQVFAAYITV